MPPAQDPPWLLPDLHPDAVDDAATTRFARLYDGGLERWQSTWLGAARAELLTGLGGTVVEVGAGTGLNFPHYRSAGLVVACEPSPAFADRLRGRAAAAPTRVVVRDWAVEDLEALPAGVADAVVCTLVLCSVDDPARAVAAMARVLRPGGRLAVLEHVAGRGVRRVMQRLITPLTVRYAGNCHADRRTPDTLAAAGFDTGPLRRVDPGGWWPEFPMVAGVLTR